MIHRITILGSTGSIGQSTLKVIERHSDRFEVFALTAQTHVDLMLTQCHRFNPLYAVMQDEKAAEQLELKLRHSDLRTHVLSGDSALVEVASHPEVSRVMACIVGAAGLMPVLAAAKSGKTILLANKEALVMSGELLLNAIKESGGVLLPVDSEHNAIFQCMPPDFRVGQPHPAVRRIILTASGGAVRDIPLSELAKVTPEVASRHPNWTMGQKITVDSASMMNKGLEVIEAHFLFAAKPEQLEVVLHPQSLIHSLVEYPDGSLLAQLGQPDMRTPIAVALGWPERIESGVESLNLIQLGHLEFREICPERYPCLSLAFEALKVGGTAPVLLNAANEMAVQAFLSGSIKFTDIPQCIARVMEKVTVQPALHLEAILEADSTARRVAQEGFKSNHRMEYNTTL